MKNLALLTMLAAGIALTGCESTTEKTLRESVETRSDGLDVKYKLISANVNDTITAGRRAAFLMDKCEPLRLLGTMTSKEDFVEKRNQEFQIFRRDTTYEEAIMVGRLKDASPWCTEIRQRTEHADSILANWDSVDKAGWDFVSTMAWYNLRANQFVNNFYDSWLDESFEEFEKIRPAYEEYVSLKDAPFDSVIYYAVDHQYSIFNPIINQRVELRDSVLLTPSGEVADRISNTDFGALLRKHLK